MSLAATLAVDDLRRAVTLPRRVARAAAPMRRGEGVAPEPSGARHVAVVGAGAAGLATALGLSRRGIRVTLLEACHCVGGRIRTTKVQGRPYDLGATWAHGRSPEENPALSFAEQLPLLRGGSGRSGKLGARAVMGTDGSEVDAGLASRLAGEYASALEECEGIAHGKDIPELGELPPDVEAAVEKLLTHGTAAASSPSASFTRAAYDWRAQLECTISGCDAVSDLSLSAWGEYQDLPHAVRASNRWQGGFSAVMQAALGELCSKSEGRGDVDVRLGCSVRSIHWTGGGVRIATESSADSSEVLLEADHVVVTASLGVLKASVAENQPLKFNPPLPAAKRRAIATGPALRAWTEMLGFGTVDKVLLLYPSPWWSDLWATLRFLWPRGEEVPEDPPWLRRVYGCTGVCDNAGLEFWLAGSGAHGMEASTDNEVETCLHRLLVRCAGAGGNLPAPSGLLRSSWGSNPAFRGSYSFVPVGAAGEDIEELCRPEGENMELSFAGEHTHRSYYSTVHGAWWSGVRAAQQLANR